MKIVKITIVTLVLSFTCQVAYMQQTYAQPMPSERHERLQQRVEMMRIWKLTDLLNLNEEQADIFFPRYRRYLAELDSLEKQRIEIDRKIGGAIDSGDADFADLVDKSMELEKMLVNHKHSFVLQNSELLSPRNQAALLVFEQRFHQRLREMARDLRDEHVPPFGTGGPRGQGRGYHRGWEQNRPPEPDTEQPADRDPGNPQN